MTWAVDLTTAVSTTVLPVIANSGPRTPPGGILHANGCASVKLLVYILTVTYRRRNGEIQITENYQRKILEL